MLITPYGNFNYGNILQRYALTQTLENLGFIVDHLCEVRVLSQQARIIKRFKQIIKFGLALIGIKKYRKKLKNYRANRIKNLQNKELNLQQEKRFKSFQDNFTPAKIFMTYKQALKAPKSNWESYALALTGSDQVWHNFSMTQEELQFFYLEFMPKEKRINYAPSFGFSEFPKKDLALHKTGLQGFYRLSCREQEGCNLIKSLTGREAQLVLDPTLLLDANKWRNSASKPDYNIPERYVLCYFLDEITPEFSNAIHQVADKLPIVNLYNSTSSFEFKPYYFADPAEFIYLFDHADFICTNSFHGIAFSVNFGKNFLAFKRKSIGMKDMFGRIESILGSLEIHNHVYEAEINKRPDAINYDCVYEKLNAMRKSSMQYLLECLNKKSPVH